jgi:hypothetical protein
LHFEKEFANNVQRQGGSKRMGCIIRCVLAGVCVFSCAGALAVKDDVLPTPQQLIQVTNQSSDVLKVIPYRLTADLIVTPDKDVVIRGHIIYDRDRDRERIEITAGDYHETWVNADNKLYVAGTRSLVLPRGSTLKALEKEWVIHDAPSCCQAFSKVERKKTRGADAYCFVATYSDRHPKRFCVDRDAKSLLERFDGFETVVFSDYRAIEGLRYPARIQYVDDGKPFVEIENIEIRKTEISTESFNAPPNSQEFENCAGMETPHTLHMEMPKVPSRWHSSYASVKGLVQPDGSFTDVRVQVSRANPEFAKALEEAAGHWLFSPARCGSKPVVYEEQMEIHN